MRQPSRILLAALLLGTGAAYAGTADVRFIEPEKFSDFASDPMEQREATQALVQHFNQLAARLPPDTVLHVDVLDVRLAGTLQPSPRRGYPVRVLNGGADWPAIKLRWTLEANGQGLNSGEERLTDLGYLSRGGALYPSASGDFYYEKRLLDNWFNSHFAGGPPPRYGR